MLVDYQYANHKLYVSYIDSSGKIKIRAYPWHNPMKYEPTHESDPDADPNMRTWDAKPVKQVPTRYPDRYAVYEFLDAMEQEEKDLLFGMFEADMFFLDIETEIPEEGGFIEPKDATMPVLTVAIVHKSAVLLLGYKPLTDQEISSMEKDINDRFKSFGKDYKVQYKDYSKYKDPEKSMMSYLFNSLIPKMSILTGWNFVNYDWTYLINRARNIGIDPLIASPTKKFNQNWKNPDEELPMHRIVVDYMELFAKWDTSIKIRESMALDFVATKTLGVPKIAYTGGLQDLYNNDFKHYLFYNAVDTILVQLIHEKMKYANIMFAISKESQIRILDTLSSLRVTEGVLREKLRQERNIVFCKDVNKQIPTESVAGGFVKDPVTRGLVKWVACYDFASLYPTTMRQNNIGPENFKGVLIDENTIRFGSEVKQRLDNDIVCNNNVVFSGGESVTVNRLTEIYYDRKKWKKKMFKAKKELEELEKELKKIKIQ